MALHLKEIVRDLAMYEGPVPRDIEGANFWDFWDPWRSWSVDPEEGDDVDVMRANFRAWIKWAVDVLGYSQEAAIRGILSWAGLGNLAQLGSVTLEAIPSFGYGPINPGLGFVGPRIYIFDSFESGTEKISNLGYSFYTKPAIFGNEYPCNGMGGESVVTLLQEAGYSVTNDTTVEELRGMVPSLEAWLDIAAWLISANGAFSDYYNNPDTCLGDIEYEELSGGTNIPALDASGGMFDYYGFANGACVFIPATLDGEGNPETFIVCVIESGVSDLRPCAGTLKIYTLERGEPYVSETTTPAGEGETLIKTVAAIPTVIQNVSVSGLTPEQIVATWPEFAKYFEEAAPIGLSATKKHFIRVI